MPYQLSYARSSWFRVRSSWTLNHDYTNCYKITLKSKEQPDSVSKYHIVNRVAPLAEHWASVPKVAGSIPAVVTGIFFNLPSVNIHSE